MDKPVAGYFRISQAHADMIGPEVYRGEIERYCEYKGLALERMYADIDRSGFRNSPPRPELELLKERRLTYSAVIVPKLSRFGRSVKDLVALFDLFDQDGVSLVFLDMNLDTSTSQGRLLRHVMAAFAEYESDVKADYARANNKHRVERGQPLGPAPFGYRFDRNIRSYVINKQEAEVVREIFSLYQSTDSLGAVCRALNDRGLRTMRGKLWTTGSISCKLTNPAYVGLVEHLGHLSPGTWEPIVDLDTWQDVQRIRSAAVARYLRKNPAPGKRRYLLTGLLRCGVCGRGMHARAGSRTGSHTYICPGSRAEAGSVGSRCPGGIVGADRAEGLVFDAFRDRFCSSIAEESDRPQRSKELHDKWVSMTIDKKREFLALTIDHVELIPRESGDTNRLSGTRHLRIVWGDQWSKVEGSSVTDTSQVRGLKTCRGCLQRLPEEAFHWKRRHEGLRHPRCISCVRDAQRRREKRGPTWAQWRKELQAERWADSGTQQGEASALALLILMSTVLAVALWAVARDAIESFIAGLF